MLHDSTIAALKQYGFLETAAVLELFAKLWSVLNVSSPDIGMRKRDIFHDPVRLPDDWKLDFFMDFSAYTIFWENAKVNFNCYISCKIYSGVVFLISSLIKDFLVSIAICANPISYSTFIYWPVNLKIHQAHN